jgi:hypothetical protein
MGGEGKPQKPSNAYWLVYLALLIGGILLLAGTLHFVEIQKVSARLGIAMLYSAFALFVGNGKPAGYVATAVIWLAVFATFIIR